MSGCVLYFNHLYNTYNYSPVMICFRWIMIHMMYDMMVKNTLSYCLLTTYLLIAARFNARCTHPVFLYNIISNDDVHRINEYSLQ